MQAPYSTDMPNTPCATGRRPHATAGSGAFCWLAFVLGPFFSVPCVWAQGADESPKACQDCLEETIACGETVTGDLTKEHCRDDFGSPFQIWRLDVPETLEVAIELRASFDPRGFDTRLTLLDDACEWVETTIGSLLVSRLEAGTYFVSAGAQLLTPEETGGYELEVRCLDRCRDCVAGTLACGETVQGELSEGDCALEEGKFFDVYSFHLDEAKQVDIDLTSADFDAVVLVRDSGCLVADFNEHCPDVAAPCLESRLLAGDYSVVVTSFSGNETGSYSISLDCRELGEDATCEDCLAGEIVCGEPIFGEFLFPACGGPDEQLNVYRLEVPEPSVVEIELRSGSDLLRREDVRLTLSDAACMPVALTGECIFSDDSCLWSLDLDPGSYFLGLKFHQPRADWFYSLAAACRLPPQPAGSFLRGDCNADGQIVGVTDALSLLNYNFRGGARPPCLAACDANGDGRVEGQITDSVYLLNHNFRSGPAPPPPFPTCGPPTPSDEALGCEAPPECR